MELTIHFFCNWRPMQSGKSIDFVNVCKCGMLCVNFHFVAVFNSAVMEVWPLPLGQRMKLFLIRTKKLVDKRPYALRENNQNLYSL